LINLKKENNTAAVIPFYNNRNTIVKVIEQTLIHLDHVIAVNDGSTDGSLKMIPDRDDVTLLSFEENNGKGYALSAGFKKGVELGFKTLVTLDADLQHNPFEIPFLLQELKRYDIVVGNRLNNLSGMPLQRRISNKLTSFLLSIKTGCRLLDSQCGFRAFKSDVVKNIETTYPGYEAESEILILAARNNYKIGFCNISTIYGNQKSKMNPIKTTFGFIKILFI
jgi:glycosyltransferase involved in cell wall biosynthesis